MLRLKELRKNSGKTQMQIAEYIGVSRPSYTRYELGEREPGLEMLIKLAECYNISVSELFISEVTKDCQQHKTVETISDVDLEIYDSLKSLSIDDKQNLIRYISFINKRNSV